MTLSELYAVVVALHMCLEGVTAIRKSKIARNFISIGHSFVLDTTCLIRRQQLPLSFYENFCDNYAKSTLMHAYRSIVGLLLGGVPDCRSGGEQGALNRNRKAARTLP